MTTKYSIMRAHQIDSLQEISMRPRDYESDIERGGELGVRVGFEFEVCVPRAYFTKPVTPESRDKKDVVRALNNLDFQYSNVGDIFDCQEFDSIFKVRNPGTYKTSQEALIGRMQSLIPKLRKLWEKIEPDDRVKIRRRITRAGGYEDMIERNIAGYNQSVLDIMPPEIKFMWAVRRSIILTRNLSKSYFNISDKLRDIYGNLNDWGTVLKSLTGASSLQDVMNHWNEYFDYDLEAAVTALDALDGFVQADESDEDAEFKRVADQFAIELRQTFNRGVTVFTEYHQRKKRLDRWYIEPDGSLAPKENDMAFEVVSPPYPAVEAVRVLKDFFTLVKSHGFYTGKENQTGLHINVSIPQKTDILKLAVILGDEAVLRQFGRENNPYATSVFHALRNPLSDTSRELGSDVLPLKKKIEVLSDLAGEQSRQHSASISSNGKYVSFRHAGGDYLDNPDQIQNVLGRFVRSLIIASNPGLYRQEYLSKLSKLITPHIRSEVSPRKHLIALIREGLPVLHFDVVSDEKFFGYNTTIDKNSIRGWKKVSNSSLDVRHPGQFMKKDRSTAERLRGVNADIDAQLSDGQSKTYTGTWYPRNYYEYRELLKTSYSGPIVVISEYGRINGYGVVRQEKILPRRNTGIARIAKTIADEIRGDIQTMNSLD